MFTQLPLMLVLFLLLSFAACQSTPTAEGDTTAEPAASTDNTSDHTAADDTAVETDTAADDMAADTATEPAASTDDPRTITDARGQEMTIPANPEQVVVLSEQDLDAALALDVSVVGTVNGRDQPTPPLYLGDRVESITSAVGSFTEPSLETVAELDPDLILIGGIFPAIEELLPQLAALAPPSLPMHWRMTGK